MHVPNILLPLPFRLITNDQGYCTGQRDWAQICTVPHLLGASHSLYSLVSCADGPDRLPEIRLLHSPSESKSLSIINLYIVKQKLGHSRQTKHTAYSTVYNNLFCQDRTFSCLLARFTSGFVCFFLLLSCLRVDCTHVLN